MPGPQVFGPQDLRLMQGLAQQVTALRPELVNSDATVGEMAWVWGKDRTDLGGTWRHRLCFSGGRLAGWGPEFQTWLDQLDAVGARIAAEKMFTFSMEN